jgi:hypothetical protein
MFAQCGAQWVLRLTVNGKRREMGLGGALDVPLAEARVQANRWRAVAKTGRDPIEERKNERGGASVKQWT